LEESFKLRLPAVRTRRASHRSFRACPPELCSPSRRKPGADELSSPRKEPDLPIIYSGINAADTIENAGNKGHTNGTPLVLLIPNLDRHFIHIKQYQDTNRTPRPGHASYASFAKYGPDDDAIGAGLFSGRYSSTIVGAGYVAKKVLKRCGIEVFSYVKEIAGVRCPDTPHDQTFDYTERYKKMRCDLDPFYQEVYVKNRVHMDMRFLEKAAVFAEIEKEIDPIRDKAPKMSHAEIREKYGVHAIVNSPDINAAQEMVDACNKVAATGDSAGGMVEVVVTGVPAGLGEPVFYKLDGELGKMLGIGAIKAVEWQSGLRLQQRRRNHRRSHHRPVNRRQARSEAHAHHRQASEDD